MPAFSRRLTIAAFIQCRMSSRRFPGKVLAPLDGIPIIQRVLHAVRAVKGIDRVVATTSTLCSDDPLVSYLRSLGVTVLRGPLENVFQRFRQGALEFPSDWILRICGDSPLLQPVVLKEVVSHAQRDDCDLVTTRFAPAFPSGQNAELIRTRALLEIDPAEMTGHDCEHVTPYFYRHASRYRLAHARPVSLGLPGDRFAVDTPEDLLRCEALLRGQHAAAIRPAAA